MKRIKKIKERKETIKYPVEDSEDFIERKKSEKDAWQAAEIIVYAMLEGYEKGEIEFENLCRLVEKALRPESIRHLRMVTLGKIVSRALKIAPPKKRRSRKIKWISEASAELCVAVKEKEGLPITRSSLNRQTVFERVVEIMKFRGINVTKSQVERNYGEYIKRLRK